MIVYKAAEKILREIVVKKEVIASKLAAGKLLQFRDKYIHTIFDEETGAKYGRMDLNPLGKNNILTPEEEERLFSMNR